jgi:hypothetical protein
MDSTAVTDLELLFARFFGRVPEDAQTGGSQAEEPAEAERLAQEWAALFGK